MNRRVVWLLFVVVSVACANAEASSVSEPETFNAVVYMDPTSGKFLPLERETASVSTKPRALGFGGAKQIVTVPGSSSSLKLTAGQPHRFAVRVAQGTDPGKFLLYKFVPTSNGREVMVTNAYVVGVETGMGTVHYDASVLGASSFKFTLDATLPSGEYGFSSTDSQDVFLFSLK